MNQVPTHQKFVESKKSFELGKIVNVDQNMRVSEKFMANTKYHRFRPPVALFGRGQLETDRRIELGDAKNPKMKL